MITFLTFLGTIGGFFIKNWSTIETVLASVGSLLGISCLQVFNRAKKIEQENKRVEAMTVALPENHDIIKAEQEKSLKQGKFKFAINNIMLVAGLGFVNWFVIYVIKLPLLNTDPNFAKNILSGLLFIDFFILMMIAGRIVSSVNTFDSFIQNLPLVRNFFRK